MTAADRQVAPAGTVLVLALGARKARILLGRMRGDGARGAQVAARLDAWLQTAGGRR